MIPYSRQKVTEEDVLAVTKVLRSDFLTQGPVVTEFENKVAGYCNAQYAVATCNATAALHVACMAMGVTSDSLVWTSSVSFVASANCALYCGSQIDFVDIDLASGQLSLVALEQKLNTAALTGELPDVLVVVHLAGQSCSMKEIYELCHPRGIRIIEDASHALGGWYLDKPVGSCIYSNCCVFSFHPVKPITSGEGGMLVTNNKELAKQARLLISHGIERDADFFEERSPGGWYYEQQLLGFNYRFSDIHAALGLSQMQRIDEAVELRFMLAHRYDKLLARTNIRPLNSLSQRKSSCHLYVVRMPNEQRQRQAYDNLRELGFAVNLHYLAIPSHPYFRRLGFNMTDFPEAEKYAKSAISLPLFRDMATALVDEVVSALLKATA